MVRLLCVDDDPMIRTFLSSRLAIEPDVEVVGAVAGAAEALSQVRASPIDVLLLDYQLTGVNGLQFLQALESEKELAHRPAVLFCTGWADEAFEEKASALGAAGVLAKSHLSSDLVPAVRAVAAGGRWYPHLPS